MGSYFVVEADGAKKQATKLGVGLQVVDSGQDPQKDVTLAQTLVTQGVKGIGVVPSNTDIGPRVFKVTDGANIPLVASDSPLTSADGKKAPFVGLDQTGSGTQVGQILGSMYKAKGWAAADTYYANVLAGSLQVCVQRNNAEVAAFMAANPDFPKDHVIDVPYDGTPGAATTAMKTVITAHPEAKYWLSASCNDDGVVGVAKALQGTRFPAANMLGVGLGGDLACQIYTDAFQAVAIPSTTYLDAGLIGATVVDTLYKIVVQKQNVTGNVYVPTPQIDKDSYAKAAACK